jgi:DNA-binding NtrC family response regulator
VSDLNLLLVDDENDFLSAITERLVERGLNVLSACDGKEALQIMKRLRIDVVVLDMVMPGQSGLETLVEMKKDYPETEVIMLTGFADIKAAVDSMTRGAFDYLTKPVSMDRLLSRIRDAHKRKTLGLNLKEAKDRRVEP